MTEHPGYEAPAHARDRRIAGIIGVHRDSPLHDLVQLDGATVAFPAPAAWVRRSTLRARARNSLGRKGFTT